MLGAKAAHQALGLEHAGEGALAGHRLDRLDVVQGVVEEADQVAHGFGLPPAGFARHPHQGIIYRCVAVGVIFTQNFPHYTGALLKGAIVSQTQLVHGVEDATMHRF